MNMFRGAAILEWIAREIIPTSARIAYRRVHRALVFRRAMTALLRDSAAMLSSSSEVLSDLVYGWGNEGWSGQPEYLRACAEAALSARGPILECGSGLSTLVLGIMAKQRGGTVWSLEHLPDWAERVQAQLDVYAIANVRLHISPLRDYGRFDWYAPRVEHMPSNFGLVVCDGPPSATRGGRYGLLPVMHARLQPGCVVLLDDAARDDERMSAERWATEFGCTFARQGQVKPYFAITLAR